MPFHSVRVSGASLPAFTSTTDLSLSPVDPLTFCALTCNALKAGYADTAACNVFVVDSDTCSVGFMEPNDVLDAAVDEGTAGVRIMTDVDI